MQDVEMSVEGFNNVFSYVVLHLTNWWWCKMEMNIIIRHLTTYHSIPLNTSTAMHHHINTIMAVPSKNFEMCTYVQLEKLVQWVWWLWCGTVSVLQ